MEELKKIAPNLSEISKDNPWKVPENYFENFSVRLSDIIHRNNVELTEKRLPALKPYYAVIMVAATLFIAVFFIFIKPEKREGMNLVNSDFAANIVENIYDYNEDLIIEAIYFSEEPDINGGGFTDKEIIDYLMNEDININDVLNSI